MKKKIDILLFGFIIGSLIGGIWVQYRITGDVWSRTTIKEEVIKQFNIDKCLMKNECSGLSKETKSNSVDTNPYTPEQHIPDTNLYLHPFPCHQYEVAKITFGKGKDGCYILKIND